MARKQTRKAVSLSKKTYERMQALAQAAGMKTTTWIDQVLNVHADVKEMMAKAVEEVGIGTVLHGDRVKVNTSKMMIWVGKRDPSIKVEMVE